MGSLDVSLYGYNDGKLELLLHVDPLRSTDGNVLGSSEGIKIELSGGKVICTILGMSLESHLGMMMDQR